MTGHSGTNAWRVQTAREGIATAVVSLPLKYMHSPVETLDLTDLEATASLLAAFVQDLSAEGGPSLLIDTLKTLCALPGVSSRRTRCGITSGTWPPPTPSHPGDAMGNLIVERKGRVPGRHKLMAAHMDEVGLMVHTITEEGYLKFDTVGASTGGFCWASPCWWGRAKSLVSSG